MTNPQAPTKVLRHYFYMEASNFLYYSTEKSEITGHFTYIGSSDNPKPMSAATAFMQSGKLPSGFKIRDLDAQ